MDANIPMTTTSDVHTFRIAIAGLFTIPLISVTLSYLSVISISEAVLLCGATTLISCSVLSSLVGSWSETLQSDNILE